MSKFLTGKDLDDAICDIIWETEKCLMIVSPFIKLDDYFKKLFDKHENNPKIHLIIVFGKNENDVRKSLRKTDFDYFKKFLNVSIIYVPNLHAKYYGNEKQGIVTSINLYDYSFKNNIEFGVHTQQSILDKFKKSTENDAWDECMKIANSNEVVFIKRPVFEVKKIIFNLGKGYVKSDILLDLTDNFYKHFGIRKDNNKMLFDFPLELELGSIVSERPEREIDNENKTHIGYCIRTGEKINFNPKHPMSRSSWKVWNEYGNEDFPENYCHKTGERSYGKTSMRNPIL